jgi:hypothetical protein
LYSYFVFVFVYLPTDLSLTDNFHKFQLKIRIQTSRKQKTKAVNYLYDKKKILLKRYENKSMKRKICDPSCHEKKVVKNVRYYVATSEESEDTTKQYQTSCIMSVSQT